MWPLELLGAYFVLVGGGLIFFDVHPQNWGWWSNLTNDNVFQMGWNYQVDDVCGGLFYCFRAETFCPRCFWFDMRTVNRSEPISSTISYLGYGLSQDISALQKEWSEGLWREPPPLKRLEDWCWIGVTIQFATRYCAIFQVREIYYSGIILVPVSFNRSWLCAWLQRWCVCGKPFKHGILMVCVLCVLFLFSLDRCMNLDVYFGI